MRTGQRRVLGRGKRWKGAGIETYCRVNGEWRSEYWTADTPEARMDLWLSRQKEDRKPRSARKSLRGMVPDYLDAVAALPSIRDRTRDIGYWVDEFGDRAPQSISRAEVQAVLQRWQREHVAVSTIRHRRSALSNFFEVMLPDCDNPARKAKAPAQEKRQPRAIPVALLEAIIAKMPDLTRSRKGEKRHEGSQAKARMRVLMLTGIPPKQMMQLREPDVDLDRSRVYVTARRKGKGHAATWLPLTPKAVEAFREWVRLDCWGRYSTSSVRASFRRAAAALQRELAEQGQKIDLSALTPYDARHSFAAHALAKTGDAPGLQRLMLHSTLAQTMHYAEAGIDPRAQAVIDALGLE